jgi:UDP-N-acetylmuramate dehydrogenase
MNAGGHGRDTAAVVVDARIGSLGEGGIRTARRDDLAFGYRRSALGPRDVVLGARFAGEPADPAEGAERIDEIVRWRRANQPGGQNAGSVFTNPPDDAAGRLIEAAGCKGLRIGGARVSEKHANFFVADAGAKAADVHALVREVQRIVEDAFGVRLEPELHLVGFASEDER